MFCVTWEKIQPSVQIVNLNKDENILDFKVHAVRMTQPCQHRNCFITCISSGSILGKDLIQAEESWSSFQSWNLTLKITFRPISALLTSRHDIIIHLPYSFCWAQCLQRKWKWCSPTRKAKQNKSFLFPNLQAYPNLHTLSFSCAGCYHQSW